MSFSLFSIALFSLSAQASPADALNTPDQLAARCQPQSSAEETLYSSDFHWSYSMEEMIARFQEIYSLERRLGKRAYFDRAAGDLKLPYYASRGGEISLPLGFVESVQRHVEEALRLGYVDGIFFPDMGHSHFLIPTEKFEREYKGYPVEEMSRLYEKYFSDPELKVAYHTAEQLQMTDEGKRILPDRRLQWRFFSRNLVGDNLGLGRLELHQNPGHSHNTINGAEGYHWWGAGFNISANQRGCIAYSHNGEIRYFDLSMFDLEQKPGEGGGGEF